MFGSIRQIIWRLAIACILLGVSADVAQACPFCKAALESSDSGGDVVAGFFWSILFMLSMPPLIIAGIGGYFYLLVRRARAENPNWEQLGTGVSPFAGQEAGERDPARRPAFESRPSFAGRSGEPAGV